MTLGRKIFNWFATAVAILVIVLAILLGLFRLTAAQLPEYRADLEKNASKAVGLPVRFGSVDARLGLGGPELLFFDVRVLDPKTGQVLIRSRRGGVTIDPVTLIRDGKIKASRVFLDGASLRLERTKEGKTRIQGMDTGAADGGEGLGATDIPEGIFELRRANIVVEDLKNELGPWSFRDVELRLQNDGRNIAINGRVELPDKLGESVTLQAELKDLFSDPEALSWEAHVQGKQLNLDAWAEIMPKRYRMIEEGNGDLSVHLFMENGLLDHASLRLDLHDTRIFLSRQSVASVAYDAISGRLELDRLNGGWTAAARDFRLIQAGKDWPGSDVSVEYHASAGPDSQSELSGRRLTATASFLGIEELAVLAGWLPDNELTSRLLEFRPAGRIHDLELTLGEDIQGQVQYQINAEIRNLAFGPAESTPGVSGLSGIVDIGTDQGRVSLDSNFLEVEVPGVFRKPLLVDRISGDVRWRSEAGEFRVTASGLQLDHGEMQAVTEAMIEWPQSGEPNIQMTVDVAGIRVAYISDLLPAGVMSARLVEWLDSALVSGSIPEANIVIDGPLGKFPFRDGDGVFSVKFPLQDLTLQFDDRWPTVTNAGFQVKIDGRGLTAYGESGEVLGTKAKTMRARIDNFKDPVLDLQLKAVGSLDNTWQFVLQSPLAEMLGESVKLFTVAGQNEINMELTVPLNNTADTKVDLHLDITNGQFAIDGLEPEFSEIDGTLRIQNEIVSGTGFTARFFDAPVSIDIEPQFTQDKTLAVIQMTGRLDGEDLASVGVPLASLMSGSTAYQAAAVVATQGGGNFVLRVNSDLDGLVMDWPAPLKKASESRPIQVDLELLPAGLMDLAVNYQPGVRAAIRLKRVTGKPWQVETGMITTEGIATLPDQQGLVVTGHVVAAELEEWLSLKDSTSDDTDFELQDILREIDISIEHARAIGYEFGAIGLGMLRTDEGWLLLVSGESLDGTLQIPFRPQQDSMRANMNRVWMTQKVEENAGDHSIDPRNVPAAHIVIEDFRLSDMILGSTKATARKSLSGVVVEQLEFMTEPLHVTGNASWLMLERGEETQLDLLLVSDDVTAALANLNMARSLQAKRGTVSSQLYWPGSPNVDFLPLISGNVSLDFRNGELLDLEPGAGRLLGLLSITTLPRRLALDFSDFFKKGLSFDKLSGDYVIREGNAFTNNMTLDGPAAKAIIRGRTGLATRDYDQTAEVIANLGNTLPVAGAIAGGPAVGAAVFLLSKLFQKPLDELSQAHYRISGSWDDPVIEPFNAQTEVVEAAAGDGA
jgi:uncharacterized protein (TIGR02099 family)